MSTPSTTTDRSHESPSKVTAIKDQAVGTIKETLGNVLHKEKMEVEGRVQKEHGKIEYELTKGNQGSHSQINNTPPSVNQQSFPESSSAQVPPSSGGVNLYPTAGLPYPTGGSPNPPAPINQGPATAPGQPNPQDAQAPPPHFGQPNPGGPPPSQPTHVPTDQHTGTFQGDKASSVEAMKDKTMGSMKEKVGDMTGNQDLELKGKAQNIHGQNEAEVAKAQKEGTTVPAQTHTPNPINA